jgi:hypothetical protein
MRTFSAKLLLWPVDSHLNTCFVFVFLNLKLLGINIFTFVLAGLIAFFFMFNAILGPGWLGQKLGFEGTGTYTEISNSFPSIVNLDSSENLL